METKTYDFENQVLTSTDRAGNKATYSYDDDGRLTTTIYSDGLG